jgi:hypothetical protein
MGPNRLGGNRILVSPVPITIGRSCGSGGKQRQGNQSQGQKRTMVQELVDLRSSIVEGRYEEALEIIDELEGMSKAAILRNIDSYLVRLLVHLIKNQIEQRLTKSWAISIVDSVRQIQKLNLKDIKKSYYIKADEWQSYLEEAIAAAVRPASLEVLEGQLKTKEVKARIEADTLINFAQELLSLTYQYSAIDLPDQVESYLSELPGGEEYMA